MAERTGSELSVGVVIPCHDNSWRLRGVLESLRCQTERPDAVVVVDDNSGALEGERLRRACREFAVRHALLPAPADRWGALGRRSAARNLGTRLLETDVILYLDGDMLLGPRYVAAIKHYHARFERLYIRGRRCNLPEGRQGVDMNGCLQQVARTALEPLARNDDPLPYIMAAPTPSPERMYGDAHVDRWEWCASNNLSVRAEHVSRIGYWDEGFVGWGEEDMDFSFRLYRSGLTPILLLGEDAVAYHLDHPVDRKANAITLRRNAERLLSKFPQVAELRMEAYARYGIDIEALRLGERRA